jgi:hypothetical protein
MAARARKRQNVETINVKVKHERVMDREIPSQHTD